MLRRRMAAAVLALVAAGSLTACGSKGAAAGGGSDTLAVQHDAFGQLVQAMTAKTKSDWSVHMGGTVDLAAGTQNVHMKIDGDAKQDASGVIMKAKYDIDTGGQPMSATIVLVDEIVYMKLPPSAGLPADRPWVKVTPDGTDPLSKQLGPQLKQLKQSADPRQILTYLQDNDAVTINATRPEPVDGTPATRYDVTVDVAKLAASGRTALTDDQVKAMSAAGIKTMNMSMWVSDDQLPLRSAIDQPLGGVGSMKISIDFTHWGEQVRVNPPNAGEISQFPGR